MIDVKEILDIPNIENYLDKTFRLDLYDVGDKTIIYEYELENDFRVIVDLISDETLIIGSFELADILIEYDIKYFEFTVVDNFDKIISSHHYRPLVDDKEKIF